MAIKQRVLKSIRYTMDLLETCDGVVLPKIVASLEDVDSLLQDGLISEYRAHYKEIVDGVKSALQSASANDVPVVCSLSNDLLSLIEKQIASETHFKKEIVFLPYNASMWDSMESVWQAAKEDKDHVVTYVVPIPYCDRNPDGSAHEWHIDNFPKYVPIVDYRRIDLRVMRPDVIVIHYPYDAANNVTSVSSEYYAAELKHYTNRLVYIPYFILEEIEPGNKSKEREFAKFVLLPGVTESNLTIVQSDKMRDVYVNILSQSTDKTEREYWEKRILGLGSPKIDKVLLTRRECMYLPKSWRQIIEKANGQRKKVFLYSQSFANLLHYEDKMLDKLEWSLSKFYEQLDEVALLWRPHPLFVKALGAMRPELLERYVDIVERYRNGAWGIYDESANLHRAVAVSDIYYGGESSLVGLFVKTNRATVLQDIHTFGDTHKYLLAPSAAVLDKTEENVYCLLENGFPGLFRVNIFSGQMSLVSLFPNSAYKSVSRISVNTFCVQKCLGLIKIDNFIFILPWNCENILCFDLVSEKFSSIDKKLFWHNEDVPLPRKLRIVLAVEWQRSLYMVNQDGIVFVYDLQTGKGTVYTQLYENNDVDTSADDVIPLRQRSDECCVKFNKIWAIKGKSDIVAFDMKQRCWKEFPPVVPKNRELQKILSYKDGFILIDGYSQCYKWHP